MKILLPHHVTTFCDRKFFSSYRKPQLKASTQIVHVDNVLRTLCLKFVSYVRKNNSLQTLPYTPTSPPNCRQISKLKCMNFSLITFQCIWAETKHTTTSPIIYQLFLHLPRFPASLRSNPLSSNEYVLHMINR